MNHVESAVIEPNLATMMGILIAAQSKTIGPATDAAMGVIGLGYD
jgi:hypothetical protein